MNVCYPYSHTLYNPLVIVQDKISMLNLSFNETYRLAETMRCGKEDKYKRTII